MKMQTAIERLIVNKGGTAYRKSYLTHVALIQHIVIDKSEVLWLMEDGDIVGPFIPDVSDFLARDWIYEPKY
jgi:hypothetical protein